MTRDYGYRDRAYDDDEQRHGKYAKCPSGVEVGKPDAARLVLPQEETGDDEAGNDEEHVHSKKPAPGLSNTDMEQNDEHDSYGP
jgi:hypothetical protein